MLTEQKQNEDMRILEGYLGIHWKIESLWGGSSTTYHTTGMKCFLEGGNIVLVVRLHKRRRDIRKRMQPAIKYRKLIAYCKTMANHSWSQWRLDKDKILYTYSKTFDKTSDNVAWIRHQISLQDPNCREKFWKFVKLVEELYS